MNMFCIQIKMTYDLCRNSFYIHRQPSFDISRIWTRKNHICTGGSVDYCNHFTHTSIFSIHYSLWLLFLISDSDFFILCHFHYFDLFYVVLISEENLSFLVCRCLRCSSLKTMNQQQLLYIDHLQFGLIFSCGL